MVYCIPYTSYDSYNMNHITYDNWSSLDTSYRCHLVPYYWNRNMSNTLVRHHTFPTHHFLVGFSGESLQFQVFIGPLSPSLSSVAIFNGRVIRIGGICNASETICWFDLALNEIGWFWWIFKTIFNNLFCFIDEVLWKIFLGV